MMNQEGQVNNSAEPLAILPAKRRRGRPRKDEHHYYTGKAPLTPASDLPDRNRPHRAVSDVHADNVLVGQIVSGVLDGSFDAGYLLTVKVGNTNTILRGIVFEPGLSVPISASNDVAPNAKMFKRGDFPIPVAFPLTQVSAASTRKQQSQSEPAIGAVPKIFTAAPLPDDNCSERSKHQLDAVHQKSPSPYQASPSNIEKGKLTEISSQKTNFGPKEVVDSHKAHLIAAEPSAKSNEASVADKSSDECKISSHEVLGQTGDPAVVLHESKSSLPQNPSSGTTVANDLKLEPKVAKCSNISSGDIGEAGIVSDAAAQAKIDSSESALDLDSSVTARSALADASRPPATVSEASRENISSLSDGSACTGMQANLVAPSKAICNAPNEIAERYKAASWSAGMPKGGNGNGPFDLQSGYIAHPSALDHHDLHLDGYDLAASAEREFHSNKNDRGACR